MCKYWNISTGAYNSRIKKGWSVEKALTTPTTKFIYDPYKNPFETIKQMANAYNLQAEIVTYNIRNNKSLIEALDIIPVLKSTLENYKFNENLTILRHIDTDKNNPISYFMCLFYNHETILTKEAIIEYCKTHLPPDKNPLLQN